MYFIIGILLKICLIYWDIILRVFSRVADVDGKRIMDIMDCDGWILDNLWNCIMLQ